jgi:pyruvate dehydrogenase E1 component alpha subunit/2-oxoisovalerate dehydrogenase E1 component alpha subunit
MAASKSTPPSLPGKLTPVPVPAPAAPAPARKIRAGMRDPDTSSVEVWSDDDHRRATGLFQVLAPDGKADRAAAPPLGPDELREIHRGMLRMRLLDERMLSLQRQGRVGFYAEARGQEASVIGAVAALGPEDWVVPSHREVGAGLFRGLPLRAVVAQLLGNAHDIGKGRQMPVHPAAPRALNFVPPSSCVATQLPHAVGIAWAANIDARAGQRKRPVVLTYLGEGATSAEDFHTALNFAAVYHAPVVFLCENNQWAISTPASEQTASETFAVKALAYGMPGVRVDGNDALAVYTATREAVDRARRGDGPTLIEAVTYRLGAHSTADDPSRYRDPADEAAWRDKDPLLRLATWLAAEGILPAAAEQEMRAALEQEIKDALEAEEGAGPPPLRTLIEDVFARPTPALEEQLADLERVRAGRGGDKR